jgi:replicative superfamily II helicase
VKASILAGNQVMVFVHSRNDTMKTAEKLLNLAQAEGREGKIMMKSNQCDLNLFAGLFIPKDNPRQAMLARDFKSKSKDLMRLIPSGIAMHHAGMLRADRNLVERFFSEGIIKVC